MFFLKKSFFMKQTEVTISGMDSKGLCWLVYVWLSLSLLFFSAMNNYAKCSMYGMFTYIYHEFKPHVDKYSIHGAYGYAKHANLYGVLCFFRMVPCSGLFLHW